MTLRPRVQQQLKNDEAGETLYYIPHTGARFVHITCVARGRRHPDTNQLVGETNYTEWCAETQAFEDTQSSLLQVLKTKLRVEKRLNAALASADAQWKEAIEEEKKMWTPTSEEWQELQREKKGLEEMCSGYEKQLNELRIMKWICAEWGIRLVLRDRPINKHSRPYNDWYVDLKHLEDKVVVKTETVITQPQVRVFMHEQTGFYRKRICGTVGISYSEENPHMLGLVYMKTQYGGERKPPFWKREAARKKLHDQRMKEREAMQLAKEKERWIAFGRSSGLAAAYQQGLKRMREEEDAQNRPENGVKRAMIDVADNVEKNVTRIADAAVVSAPSAPDSPVIVQAGIADADILMGADEATAADDVAAVEAACGRRNKACTVM